MEIMKKVRDKRWARDLPKAQLLAPVSGASAGAALENPHYWVWSGLSRALQSSTSTASSGPCIELPARLVKNY